MHEPADAPLTDWRDADGFYGPPQRRCLEPLPILPPMVAGAATAERVFQLLVHALTS